jgi:histidinol dehydrogenase
VAQGEHDPEALAVFITSSRKLAAAVVDAVVQGGVKRSGLKENTIAQQAITRRGAALVASSRQQAMQWANRIAPEHITVEKRDLPLVQNAGSVFVGDYSAQAAGDYAAGPNHVLPTAGAARFRAGLSVLDFVKVITVQEFSSKALTRIAPVVELLAETEGLRAHAESIRVRYASA